MILSLGQNVSFGASVSLASTLTLHCLAFPAASVAVYVTVIGVPTVTFSGDFWLIVTDTCPLLSFAFASGRLTSA